MSATGLTPRERLAELASAIAAAPRIAVDTEFHAEHRYLPRLCLLQVNVPGAGIHLIDALDPESLGAVGPAMSRTPWLLHAGRQDLVVLALALGGVPDDVVDTQVAGGLCSAVYPSSYGDLSRDLLGVAVDKAATLSDWSRRPLGEEQLRYAAEDVRLLPALWEALRERLDRLGRLEVAGRAFDAARRAALAPVDPDAAWRDIPQAVHLDPRSRAALRALAAWREQAALDADHPARGLIGDALLVDLARRRPTSLNRILSNRRFPRKLAERHGDDLLAAIRASADAEAPPVVVPQSDADRAARWIALAAAARGADEGWSQRLVVPDAAVEAIVLDHRDAPSLADHLEEWQLALAGGWLGEALAGRVALDLRARRIALRPIPI